MEIIVFFLEGTVMKEKERGRMKEGGSKEREKGSVVWLSGLCREALLQLLCPLLMAQTGEYIAAYS